MSINSLEKTKHDPDVDSNDMQVPHKVAVQQRSTHRTHTEDGDFGGMSKFSCKAKGCRILMVHFVDVFVEDTGMKSLVG